MSKSQVKRLSTQMTLAEAEAKLAECDSDIKTLETRHHLLTDTVLKLREKDQGLVPGVTIIGEFGGRSRKGVFQHFYRRYADSKWIKVALLKADGSVGKRIVTFYDSWEIIGGQDE